MLSTTWGLSCCTQDFPEGSKFTPTCKIQRGNGGKRLIKKWQRYFWPDFWLWIYLESFHLGIRRSGLDRPYRDSFGCRPIYAILQPAYVGRTSSGTPCLAHHIFGQSFLACSVSLTHVVSRRPWRKTTRSFWRWCTPNWESFQVRVHLPTPSYIRNQWYENYRFLESERWPSVARGKIRALWLWMTRFRCLGIELLIFNINFCPVLLLCLLYVTLCSGIILQ